MYETAPVEVMDECAFNSLVSVKAAIAAFIGRITYQIDVSVKRLARKKMTFIS